MLALLHTFSAMICRARWILGTRRTFVAENSHPHRSRICTWERVPRRLRIAIGRPDRRPYFFPISSLMTGVYRHCVTQERPPSACIE